MAERTLNYYKEYTILNPDGSVKEKFADLKEIKAPADCTYELYGALVKGDSSEYYWAILDGNGDYVTPAKYSYVGDYILENDETYAIPVECKDNLCNLITPEGEEIFAENYASITCLGREICILSKDCKYGLGNLKTGEVILEPRYPQYEYIRESNNEDLFFVYNYPGDMTRWGIVNSSGKELFAPIFGNYLFYDEWRDYNLAAVEKDTERGVSRYFIIDWNGKKVYDALAKSCERLQLGSPTRKVANAFLFFAEGSKYKKGEAKLVLFDYDEETDTEHIYEKRFHYRNTSAHDFVCKKLGKSRLGDLVYLM